MSIVDDDARPGEGTSMLYVARNTFIECRHRRSEAPVLRHSRSDSELSVCTDLSGRSKRSQRSELSGSAIHSTTTEESPGAYFYKMGGTGRADQAERGWTPSESERSMASERVARSQEWDAEPDEAFEACQPPDSTVMRPGASTSEIAWLESEFDRLLATGNIPDGLFAELRSRVHLIPKDDSGEFTSVGSSEHPDNCTSCIFWFKGVCKKGVSCNYCHIRHDGQKRKGFRMSKRTRRNLRKAAEDEADAAAAAMDASQVGSSQQGGSGDQATTSGPHHDRRSMKMEL